MRARLTNPSVSWCLLSLAGCGAGLTCGPGTLEQDGVCIVDETGYGQPPGTEDVTGDGETDLPEDTDARSDSEAAGGDTDSVQQPIDNGLAPGQLAPYFGNLTFTDAAGMRGFCESHDTVYGSVLIAGGSLVDLSALSCLRAVHGHLTLDARSLQVAVLPYLEVVDLDVRLEEAHALTVLQLGSLGSVGGAVVLTAEGTAPLLGTVSLSRLGSVGDELEVSGLPSLVALDLSALSSTGEALRLSDLPALSSLSAPVLSVVGGDLVVQRVGALGVLSLPSLSTVGDSLYIGSNDALTDVRSLYNLQVVVGQISFVNNPLLPSSQAQAVAEAAGAVTPLIMGNGPG